MTGDVLSPDIAAAPKPKALAVEDDETMLDWFEVIRISVCPTRINRRDEKLAV